MQNPSGATQLLISLKSANFANPIYLVNPKYAGKDFMGYTFYDSVASIKDDVPIDLAIIGVPALKTPSLVEEIGKKGIPFVHMFTSGFSELGKQGKKLEENLIEIATKYGVRILGPNCMGIHNPDSNLTFIMPMQTVMDTINRDDIRGRDIIDNQDGLDLDELSDLLSTEKLINKGKVSFISQSGGIAFTHGMISQGLGYSFSKMVLLGNQIDLDLLDFLRYFGDDPETKIISMYIENLKRDGNKFVQLLKEITLKKPIIIWKGGQLQAGHQAVMSHTGGLAGDYRMWKSMAKQTGVILVDSFIELTDMIQSCLVYSPPKTLGTAVISNSGGTAVESTDIIERNGLKMPLLSQEVTNKINQFIPEVNSNLKNPLEFGGKANLEQTINIIKMLAEEPQFSSIIMTASPEFIIFRGGVSIDDYVNEFANAIPPDSGKLLLCITSSMTMFEQGVKMNIEFRSKSLPNGFVAYRSTEAAAKCCYRLWEYGQYLEKHR